MEFVATCPKGFERLLADELDGLGGPRVRPLQGQVSFDGGLADAYRACLWSRLASRVLLVLDRVDAHDADALYEGVSAIRWEDHLAPASTFVVDAPGGGGKIPVMPQYLISLGGGKAILRNFEGVITTYTEPTDYDNSASLAIDRKNLISKADYFNPRFRYQANHYMNLAHAKAAIAAHEIVEGAQVGAALDCAPYYPASSDPADILAARGANAFKNYFYMDAYIKGEYTPSVMRYLDRQGLMFDIEPGDLELIKRGSECFDFLGVNYYQSACVKAPTPGASRRPKDNNKTGKGGHAVSEIQPDLFEGTDNPHLESTDFSMPIDPNGLEFILEEINDRYGIPVMICENGFGGYDTLEKDGSVHDPYRIEYLRAHIKAIGRAIANGVTVLGYNPWSAMDLLSTSNGIAKRYGFVYVDRTDDDERECRRYRKDSFWWYRNVIATNGKNLE